MGYFEPRICALAPSIRYGSADHPVDLALSTDVNFLQEVFHGVFLSPPYWLEMDSTTGAALKPVAAPCLGLYCCLSRKPGNMVES